MRTPSETAAYMLQGQNGNAARARELARMCLTDAREGRHAEGSERYWRDVLAALGDPEFKAK